VGAISSSSLQVGDGGLAFAQKKAAPSKAQQSADRELRKLAGRVLASDQAFPVSDKSAAKFVQRVKANGKLKIQENKEDKSWNVHYVAFLTDPIKGLEYTVRVVDVSGGTRRPVDAYQQYANQTGLTSVGGSLTFTREQIGVNRTLLITVEAGGRILGSGRVALVGEAERYKGEVDFRKEQ